MSRNGQGYKYAHGTIGAGFGVSLRANMVANLSNWTVSSLYTFGAGTTERNYFVLTHATSSAEILVSASNGINTVYALSIFESYRNAEYATAPFQQVSFAYCPDGGYLTSLVGAVDPATDSFWPIKSSQAMPLHYADNAENVEFYFITDNAKAELIAYCRSITSNSISMVILGDSVFDNSFRTSPDIETYGVIGANAVVGGFTDINAIGSQRWNYWRTGIGMSVGFLDLDIYTLLEGAIDANEPDSVSGKFYTSTIPLRAGLGGLVGHIDSNVMRMCGRTNTDTFKTLRGSDPYYYHVFRDLYTPWDNLLALPT